MYKKYDQTKSDPIILESSFVTLSIQNREHRNEIIKKNGIVCIKIWADWCEPCKAIKGAYNALAQEMYSSGKALLVEESYDNGIRTDFPDIQSIPMFLFFFKGKYVHNIVGADLGEVRRVIEQFNANTSKRNDAIDKNEVITSNVYGGRPYSGNEPLYRTDFGSAPNKKTYQ